MTSGSAQLSPAVLLGAMINNLDHQFFLADRSTAKQAFHKIEDGSQVPFMKLGFSDNTEIQCLMALDSSEFRGKLNFGRFRKNLAMMMHTIKECIEQDAPLNQMHSDTGEVLFNLPGIIHEGDTVNVMVCGLNQVTAGQAIVKLMFLDPDAYQGAIAAAREGAEESSTQN